MTETGKALTEALYGEPPRYSYFNGCSTGGHQALQEAQRCPRDYNGVVAAANAAIAACDLIDGVADSVIADPARCYFNPRELVGSSSGDCGTFTEQDAVIVESLWLGPRRLDGRFLWFGMPPGADVTPLAGTRPDSLTPQAFPITLDWFRYFLAQDPDFDWTTRPTSRT